MLRHHFHESLPPHLNKLFTRRDVRDLKVDLWNAFVDSNLVDITEHDCSAIPRILPLSYLKTIKKTCFDLTTCLMKILSLPSNEIKNILPPTPINDYLINELGVLKNKPKRLTGTMRFDMAIEGPPRPDNPPKLLEINEIGFDGVGRSSYIQETILKIFPKLKEKVFCLDTALNEVRNMHRLGKRLVRLQDEYYNWEEEVLLMKAKRVGLDIKLISPSVLHAKIDPQCTLLKKAVIKLKKGKIFIGDNPIPPDAVQISYSFELKDYMDAPKLFRMLIASKTPQYSPFISGLVAPKTILAVLSDEKLRRKLIGQKRSDSLENAIVHADLLSDNINIVKKRSGELVMKRADGMGGEHVYIGRRMLPKLKRIPMRKRNKWVVQERLDLNTMDADGFHSRKRRVIADLGAYVQYDWNGKRFTNFTVGGFITRATNRGLKVNVSGGGIQVPVMFDKSR